MLNYQCRVIDNFGDIKEINYSASDITDLKDSLAKQGMTLLSSKRIGSSTGIKLKKDDVISFTETLSLLLNSNLSLNDALNVSLNTFKSDRLIDLVNAVLMGLKKGETFSSLLKENAIGFPPMYVGLIQVGEKTGTLNGVLNHLTAYLNRNKKIKSKLQLALIYPGFITSIGILLSIVFITVILPQFYEMFSSLGEDISGIIERRGEIFTNIVIATLVLLVLAVGFVYWVKSVAKRDINRAATFEKLFLKLPLIGNLLLETQSLNLIFALNVLTDSSLTIEESLVYSRSVLSNSYLKLEVDKIKNNIISGESLSLAFSKGVFPDKISSYIKVGEKTGDINQIFSKLSEYYLIETSKKIDLFMAIIEPMFTLIIGVSLIALLVVFILPILTNMGGFV